MLFLLQPRPFCHEGSLLAHSQLGVYQDPCVTLCRAVFHLLSPSLYWCLVIPSDVHDLDFHLLNFMRLMLAHLSKLSRHLNGSTTINCWCINCFSQFCIICRGCPIIWVPGRDVKQHWPRADPCSAALVTGFQLDFLPLNTSL